MAMRTSGRGKGMAASRRRILLSYEGMSAFTPTGRVTAYCEVVLHVQVRLDSESHDASARNQDGGYDVLREQLGECAERICCFYEAANKTPATAAQAELDFSLGDQSSLEQIMQVFDSTEENDVSRET